MRFHHSTRRGRNRLGQYSQHNATSSRPTARHPTSISRWSQLGYCRETNIHFNRRLPIEPPPSDAITSIYHHLTHQPTVIDTQQSAQLLSGKLRQQQHSLEHTRAHATDQMMVAPARSDGAASPDSGTSGLLQDNQQQQQLDFGLDRLALSDDQTAAAGVPAQASAKPAAAIGTWRRHLQAAGGQEEQVQIDMESVRQKLVAQVEKHPFWSNKAARRMQLSELKYRRIYIYELISFCERRDLEWRFEPYRGGLVASIPFRRQDSAASQHSAAGSPALESPMSRPIRVPKPASGGGPESLGLWSPTLLAEYQPSAATGRSRKCRSHAGSPTRTAPNPSGGGSACKPVSAIERKLPSAEFVWSLEPPAQFVPGPFVGQLHKLELPGSSFVKRCHGCQGRGRLKCASCYGVGYEVCISCSGRGTTRSHAATLGGGARANDRCDSHASRNSTSASGYDDPDDHRGSSVGDSRGGRGANEPGGISGGSSSVSSGAWLTESCHFCHGAGQKRCWVCAGKSYNYCLACQGLGQLRCYLSLNITWANHRDEIILNNADNIIPRERLRLCSGLSLAEESSAKLGPLGRTQIDGATGRAEDSNQLHLASKRLLDKHHQTYRHERLIKQRHKVTQIQCHVINYEWKHRSGHFVIYGDELKVYIAKYPFKSICSIT